MNKIFKKIVSIAAVAAVAFTASFTLTACGGLSKDLLKDYSVDLSNVKSIGAVNGKPNAGDTLADMGGASARLSSRLSISRAGAYAAADDKNYLVTLDESGNIDEVVFKRERDGNKLRQANIKANLSNMLVTKRFTYFEYSDDKAYGEGFVDKRFYRNNAHSLSFAMDNETGKIYSLYSALNGIYKETVKRGDMELSRLGNSSEFSIVVAEGDGEFDLLRAPSWYLREDGGAGDRGTVYLATVEDGKFKLTDLVPNPRITVGAVCADVYGNVYINVSGADGRDEGNIRFYNQSYDTGWVSYARGDDGYVYRTTWDYRQQEYNIKKMNADFTESDLSADTKVIIEWGGRVSDGRILWGNEVYDYSGASYDPSKKAYVSSVSSSSNEYASYLIDKYRLIRVNRSGVYYFDLALSGGDYNGELILDARIDRIEWAGGIFYACVEGLNGALKYRIDVRSDTAEAVLADSTVYERKIIMIAPIN